MCKLYTNSSLRKDFVLSAFNINAKNNDDIYIASAFFTDSKIVEELLLKGCNIELIVRLGFPTSPHALKALIKNNSINIRFYTSNSFHPKLYIFGNHHALIGSANLTYTGITSNQEVMIEVDSENEVFEDSTFLFKQYWDEAQVLTVDVLKKYEIIYNKNKEILNSLRKMDSDIIEKIGSHNFNNINHGEKTKGFQDKYIENYQRDYQISKQAFSKILDIYNDFPRKTENTEIPLRLEVDSFLSYVREEYAYTEIWSETELGWNESKIQLVKKHISEWLNTDWYHFDDIIVNKNYPLIQRIFGSEISIKEAGYDDIMDAFLVIHSFENRFRFSKGGIETLIRNFKEANELDKVKRSMTHLLHGKGDIVVRMYDLIYNPYYKLHSFGRSNVQELVGWINNLDYPVINGRTSKVLRYYGFDVPVYN
ncbi:NgoFVII family restriction endonuclease [Enterobacteriaceae bacterium RIT711]|nr:NgoFVII family restriction endonuclease [Enterobacteriaceae bacterium RIT711]